MTAETIPQPEFPAAEQQERSRILIIDDDADQVLFLTEKLERQGFRTLGATTGAQGLELAKTRRPNLILLDLELPDMDGLDICARLADSPETCSTPVIIVSGREQADIVRRARAAGCEFFLRKPYDPNALLVLIERSLDRLLELW